MRAPPRPRRPRAAERVRAAVARGRLDAAAEHGDRLAEMEPFGADAQHLVIEVCLRPDAIARLTAATRSTARNSLRLFGSEPGWDLRDVESDLAATIAGGQVD